LISIRNVVRLFINFNADSERMFSHLNNFKTKNHNKFLSVSVMYVFKFALKARGETCINMTVEEKLIDITFYVLLMHPYIE